MWLIEIIFVALVLFVAATAAWSGWRMYKTIQAINRRQREFEERKRWQSDRLTLGAANAKRKHSYQTEEPIWPTHVRH